MVSRVASGAGGSAFPRPPLGHQGIADIEEHFQEELLALIGGIQVRHAGLVARRLGPLVGVPIDRVEVVEDAFARAGRHGRKTYPGRGPADRALCSPACTSPAPRS